MKAKQDMKVFEEMVLPVSSRLSDMLFIKLRDAILTRSFQPGYVFPNESEMCNALNVGRSTLREAYTGLVILGLITREKSGTYVNDIKSFNNVLPFSQSLEQYEIKDLMEFRSVLEGEVARIAAKNANEDDVANLEDLVIKMKGNMDDIVALTIYDFKFHMQLAEISKNKLLIDVYETVGNHIENIIHYAFKTDDSLKHNAIGFHEGLLNAIKENSVDLAGQIMRDHMKNVHDSICNNVVIRRLRK
ncbi:MAG: FadR family transcriptional regulator [Oscillospiraceae bacterium]|nr:FadR family transcriptional regulator [Oscillospiraceae bacterium]